MCLSASGRPVCFGECVRVNKHSDANVVSERSRPPASVHSGTPRATELSEAEPPRETTAIAANAFYHLDNSAR